MLLGQVFERWLGAVHRAERLLRLSRIDVEVCMISGPVGSYLHVSPAVEALVAERLGLRVAGAQSQIVTRDALAVWVAQMAGIVTVCEAIGLELRLMQHASISEALPPAGVGSSAMPHKNNPSRAERLAGLGRLARSFYEPVAAGVPQWHERDMAHSSVERVTLPQLAGITSFALAEATELLTRTNFDAKRMHAAFDSSLLDAHTHSAQTALQLAGVPHGEAQRVTREAFENSTSLKRFIKAIERHESKPKFKTPTPHRTGD
jgi:adenylosuccinate lyase